MVRMLLASLTVVGLSVAGGQVAEAGCGGFGYGGGVSYGGVGYGHARAYAGHYAHRPYRPIYRAPVIRPLVVHKPVVVHKPIVVHKPVYVPQPVVTPVAVTCAHPQHCHTWVQPGESIDAICLREYGDASLWPKVCDFNNCSTLAIGQKLVLPSIYSDGRMTTSTAPEPAAPLAVGTPPAAPLANELATPPVAPSA